MSSEQFSLCWDNFHKNMSSGMQSLLESEDLVDVTLAVEGRHLKAHKMVLSVCSPYFRELFQSSPCKHPIVFMKDVSYVALSDLLQFMYQGEVQVAQENLSSFIKTAEALQIKGLTGGGADSDDFETSDVEKPVVESSMKRIASKPSPARAKRPAGPASKRAKFSASSDGVAASTPASTSTPAIKNDTTIHPTEMIDFKIDPEGTNELSSELADESQNEKFGDDTFEEGQDDNDDYGLMETTDDEPKPGTSADGTGEGQDYYHHDIEFDNKLIPKCEKEPSRRKPDMPRFIVDGFVFHVNIMKGKPPMTYLRCLEYKRLGCHARAIIPYDGGIQDIKIKKPHNHPPDHTAEEKIVFLRELKEVVIRNSRHTVREVYSRLSTMYPNAARELPFNFIRHKMNRWRRNSSVQFEEGE